MKANANRRSSLSAGRPLAEFGSGRDYSVRTESGNDISKEKPSLADGVAGGGGSIFAPESADGSFAGPADFVTEPTGNSTMTGASQALRV
jgi:hypothetical protein